MDLEKVRKALENGEPLKAIEQTQGLQRALLVSDYYALAAMTYQLSLEELIKAKRKLVQLIAAETKCYEEYLKK